MSIVANEERSAHGGAEKACRRALVVGLGKTGIAVARALGDEGVPVRVTDKAEDAALRDGLGDVEWVSDHDPDALLADVDLVVPSPGVPAANAVLVRAQERGIPVRSEIELAALRLAAPMVAVTGTNGKSTTTELIAHILGGPDAGVFAGGNLGTPLIRAVGQRPNVAVVEVSSFQLEWVETFHPRIGLFLNVTDDHLDRHGDIDAYAALKARLFARQDEGDTAILNRDDPRVARLAGSLRARVATFGAGPLEADGAVADEERVEMRLGGRRGSYPLGRCRLLGAHNRENVMAAILAAAAMGATDDQIVSGIESFEALPHRMQLVHERGGVRFVDDSKGTNVGALVRSIGGWPDGRVVLVAGGLAKGGDFTQARELLTRKARAVVLYGAAREALSRSWHGAAPLLVHERFDDAVRAAARAAQPGDVVLLSPACASFDQFENFAKRGDAFAQAVRTLA